LRADTLAVVLRQAQDDGANPPGRVRLVARLDRSRFDCAQHDIGRDHHRSRQPRAVEYVALRRGSAGRRFDAAQRDVASIRLARGVVNRDTVAGEVWIRRHDRERLGLRLGDEKAIERIAVMRRQLRNGDDVVEANREWGDTLKA